MTVKNSMDQQSYHKDVESKRQHKHDIMFVLSISSIVFLVLSLIVLYYVSETSDSIISPVRIEVDHRAHRVHHQQHSKTKADHKQKYIMVRTKDKPVQFYAHFYICKFKPSGKDGKLWVGDIQCDNDKAWKHVYSETENPPLRLSPQGELFTFDPKQKNELQDVVEIAVWEHKIVIPSATKAMSFFNKDNKHE